MKNSSDHPKGEKDAEQMWEKLDTASLPAAAWCEALLCLAQCSCGPRVCMVASADSQITLHLPLYSSRLGSDLLAGVLCICCLRPSIPLTLHGDLAVGLALF